jgi:hypothetical protein
VPYQEDPMIKILDKYWPPFSILIMLMLFVFLFYYKSATQSLSIILIGLSVAIALVFVIQKQIQAQKQGKISLPVMWRNIVVDVLGILVSMAAVIWVACMVTGKVAQAAGKAWGVNAGILSALVAGLVVGVVVSLLVRWVWGLLTRQIKITPAKSNV